MAYRDWRGRVVGQTVTQVWEGYASRIFISFGELTPSTYVLRSGSPGRPRGKIELSNMQSESGWDLSLDGILLADCESPATRRHRALQRLAGKRLLRVQIDAQSLATVLSFSTGIAITTWKLLGSRETRPHWSMRVGENEWPPITLQGTAYRWRSKSRPNRPSLIIVDEERVTGNWLVTRTVCPRVVLPPGRSRVTVHITRRKATSARAIQFAPASPSLLP